MDHKIDRKIKEYCHKFKLYLDEEEERRKYRAQPEHSSSRQGQVEETNIGPDDNDNEEDNSGLTCHKLRLYKHSLTSKGIDVMDDDTSRDKKSQKKKETLSADEAVTEMQLEEEPAEPSSTTRGSNDPKLDGVVSFYCGVPMGTFQLQDQISSMPPSFTGYFGDGANDETSLQRIDLILVLADDNKPDTESIKVNYLMSIIKCGLEIEMEHGLMPMHKHLIFVKVHAPDTVLEEYGEIVGVKKYFKDSHLEYITPKSVFLNRFLCFCTQLKGEKEWIQIVRKQYEPPLFYSNVERSLIVYKILLHLPYGEHVNNFGLERLLDRDIVLDVYPLHDGPYFYTKDQDFTEVNARQILYYNWTGLRNLFMMQPLNVIHEYFGSRIAFYFSFFQFYNIMLVVPAIVGVAMVGFGYFDTGYYTVRNDTCNANEETLLCPRCTKYKTVCHVEKLRDHCLTADIVNTLDNRLIVLYCLIIIIWAKLLVIFWSHKETYWCWLWELNHIKNLVTMRSQFNTDYNKPNRSTKTGIWKNYNSGLTKLITMSIVVGLTLGCMAVSVFITYHLIKFKYTYLLSKTKKLPIQYGRYIVISLIVAANLLIQAASEKVFKALTILMTRFENHKTHESYERSLIVKQCVYGYVCTFSIFFYFAYIKGFKYINPIFINNFDENDRETWRVSSDQYNNCGPFRCMDELFVVLMVTQLLKQIVPKILLSLRSYIFWTRTDYNQGKKEVITMPPWEREYLLKPITLQSMLDRFNYLAQQFGLLTLFAPAFPLAAVLALIINIFHIRYDAELFLVGSRRALLIDVPGINVWNSIFNLIAYTSIVTNAGILGFTSRIARRFVYVSKNNNMTGFLMGTLSSIKLKEYNDYNLLNITFGDEECFYPGIMLKYDSYQAKHKCSQGFTSDKQIWYYLPGPYVYEPMWFKMLHHEVFLLLLFIHVGMCTLLIIQYFIQTKPQDIQGSIKVEQNVKNDYVWNKRK